MRDFNFFSPYTEDKKVKAALKNKEAVSDKKQGASSREKVEERRYKRMSIWTAVAGAVLILLSARLTLGQNLVQQPSAGETKPYFYLWEIPIQQVEEVSGTELKPPVSAMEQSNEIEEISAVSTEDEKEFVTSTSEIFGFEEGDVFAKVNRLGIEAKVEISDKAARRGKKSAKLHYAFQEGTGVQRAYIDLRDREIRLKKKVEGIGLSVYAEEELPYEVGLRIMDVSGGQYLIALSPQIDWSGWKDMVYDLREVEKYPIMIEGIYVEKNKDTTRLKGELFVDSVIIEKLQSK